MSEIIGKVKYNEERFDSAMFIRGHKEKGLSWLEERATEVEEANLRYDAIKIGTEGPALGEELKCSRTLKTNEPNKDPMRITFIEPFIHKYKSEPIENPEYLRAKYSVKVFCSKKPEGCYARGDIVEDGEYLKMMIYYRRPDFGTVHFVVEENA